MNTYFKSITLNYFLPGLILCFLCIEKAPAINSYMEGDTLHVWADGGLTIRETNAVSGKKITIIPYGEKVVVLETMLYPEPSDSVSFFESWKDADGQQYIGYLLKGRWVKIKYKGIYGFVFDGYLSHFPAPQSYGEKGYENLTAYLERVFGIKDQQSRSGDEYVMKEVYYGKGITSKSLGTKTANVKYIFPNFSIQEALILIKNSKMARKEGRPMLLEMRKTKDSQTFEFKDEDNGNGFLYLYEIGSTVIIETTASC